MKIALVGHDFNFSNKDGVSRYSYELYKRLQKSNTVFVYEAKSKMGFVANILPGFKRYFIGTKIDEDVDIVHLTYPNAIYARTKAPYAVTWHDASIFTRYAVYNPLNPDFYHYLGVVLPALRNTGRAQGITYNSEETRKSLVPYIGKCENKINEVILHAIDDAFIKEKVQEGRDRSDFVYVGSVQYSHKNIPFLISAFKKAETGSNKLYIFTPTHKDLINPKYFEMEKVKIIIGASTEEIIEKLKRSIALLHFSKLEGFGVPVLEAMAVGTPAVILENADIPKAVSKYAIKTSESSASDLISRLAKEKPELSDEAVEYAKSFSWDNTASKTLKFYKKVIERASSSSK
ncbi:MAG: glycosyltransferase [Candidatus Micrarchaeia archaeon]